MSAVGSGQPEYLFGPAPLEFFLGKEARIVAAHNFFGLVALDSLSAGVPTDNLSPWVKHKNRIVLNPVEQHPILFFAVTERLRCRPAFGTVALRAPTGGRGNQQP